MIVNKTNYKIANAHLTSRLKQTLVAILSVTFGISMYIFMNSFMTGVNDTQTGLAFSTLAHIRITRKVINIIQVSSSRRQKFCCYILLEI